MKKFYVFFIIATAYLFGTTPAYAYVYSKMILYAGNGGTVALAADKTGAYNAIKSGTENVYGSSASLMLESTTWYSAVKQGTLYFYAYARPNNGYQFNCWSTTQGGSSVSTDNPWHKGIKSGYVSQSNAVTETYYAVFAPISYSITYNLNGGTNNDKNPSSYTVESNTITLADPERGGFVFTGWTTASVGVPTKSLQIEKGSTGNKTFTANWIPATLEQSITWNQAISTKQRGDKFTLEASASSGLTVTYTAAPADLVSISGNQITCLKPGHVTITASQSGNDSYLAAASVSKEFDIFATPQIVCNIVDQYYVDDAALDLNTLWTREGTGAVSYSIDSFAESGINNDESVLPAINDNNLSLGKAGVLTLLMNVAADGYYNSTSSTKTITITKRPNPTNITFDDVTYTSNSFNMAYGAGVRVLVSTANEANTISIAQTAGADLATYYADQQAVYTSYKPGFATWSVSQPENYKYLAASATFTVNIAPAAEGTCYVTQAYTANEAKFTTGLTDVSGHFDSPIAVGENYSQLYFDAKKDNAGYDHFVVQYSTDGGQNWTKLNEPGLSGSYKTYGPIDMSSISGITHIRFGAEKGATLTKYYKNVRVTRKTYLTTSIESAEGLRIPDCRLTESQSATFNINWSRPSTSHNIHIESDNTHFTVSPAIIENVGCNHGTTPITVTYAPLVAGEETATLTIYDESEVITLKVQGKVVDKYTPKIDWLVPAVVKPNTTIDGLNNILTTTNDECGLTITSSDPSIATYEPTTQKLQINDKEGVVAFTVSQGGNDRWHPVTLLFNVFITNAETATCELTSETKVHKMNVYNTAGADGKFSLSFGAPASMVKFNAFKEGAATDAIDIVWYDGSNNKIGSQSISVSRLSTSRKEFSVSLPREARKVAFSADGTLYKYVDQVYVYRAQYLEHNATLVDGKLDFGSDEYNAEPTIREFDILYSGAGEFSVSSSNNALFTVESVSETIDCANAWGTKHISIAYNHNVVSNEQTAKLNVQLGTMVLTIPLVGTTNRPSEAIFIGNVDDDWKDPNNWLGGVTPADNADITIKGDLVIRDGEERTVNSLVIESTGSVLVVNNGSLIVNGAGTSADGTYGDLTVNKNGSVVVNSDYLTVNNLIFEASPEDNKGAVIAGSIKVAGSAYIDINMDNSGVLNDKQYYSFSVPFAVNSVERYNTATSAWESAASLYRAYSYSESTRATQGKTNACWKNVSTFAPGVFYLIEFADSKANTYRFHWAGNADGILNSEPTALNVTSTGASDERGWNGIGNTGLTYASLSDVTIMQSLSEDGKSFESFTSTTPMAIGKAAFVQVAASGSVSWIQKSVPASVAARRVAAEENELFNLHIAPLESDIFADQIFLTTSEDAQPLYEIGRDVAKMSMGTAARAQMWIDAYGKKLVAYDALLQDEQATATLGFSAPKAGEYTVSLENDFGADVYLTYEDKKIANLSLSPYTLSLNAGDNSGYGLLINRAARVTTDFMQTESQTLSAEKKLINGQLFILSAGHLFDAQGRMMK